MKGSKRIESPPMVPRKAAVVANHVGDPCIILYVDGGRDTYSLMQARQLAKDIEEALAFLVGE